MTAQLPPQQIEAIHKADVILKDAGLPPYEMIRLYLLGLNEHQVFDHNAEDEAELIGLKLCARQAADALNPVSDLGDIDHEDEDHSPATLARPRNG